ncbi:MAG: hypothetical protein NTV79_00370, partial [Candidatus Aureabacteria bacterium]|nr:hypothetical protein [Candidatus Auribacterota bacterium]
DGAYLWLVKVPLALHLILAAGFAFAFARRLGLPGPGPALFSLAYALGPLILDGSRHPPSAFSGAWLPGILWCLLRYAGSGSMKWPLLGAIVFAVASPAGDAARAISSALALAVFSAAWAIVSARRDRNASLRVVAGAGVILVLGFLLSGLYWSGVFWGAPPEKGTVFVPPSAPAGPPPRPAPLYLALLRLFRGTRSSLLRPGRSPRDIGRFYWGPQVRRPLPVSPRTRFSGGGGDTFLRLSGFLSLRRSGFRCRGRLGRPLPLPVGSSRLSRSDFRAGRVAGGGGALPAGLFPFVPG